MAQNNYVKVEVPEIRYVIYMGVRMTYEEYLEMDND